MKKWLTGLDVLGAVAPVAGGVVLGFGSGVFVAVAVSDGELLVVAPQGAFVRLVSECNEEQL